MLSVKEKEKIISQYKSHKSDTGSSEVQIALNNEEIKRLISHLKKHPKDNHSRRGLLKMVARRRTVLNYLQKKSPRKYNSIIKKIGLKR